MKDGTRLVDVGVQPKIPTSPYYTTTPDDTKTGKGAERYGAMG